MERFYRGYGYKLFPLSFKGGRAVFSWEPPSEEFISAALAPQGPDFCQCDFCGRQHFSADYQPSGPEDISYKDLLRLASRKRDQEFVASDESSLSVCHIDARNFVVGCPCNAARCYEVLLLGMRAVVADFFTRKAKLLHSEAEATLLAANSARGS
jgi:hypothetical protein